MAKKNRYEVKIVPYTGHQINKINDGYDIVDTTTQKKDWRSDAMTYYVLAHSENHEDAMEIATALNYYNNKDKD